MRQASELRTTMAAAGLYLADVPIAFSAIASRGLRLRIGADAMAWMHHLMNGAPVIAPHLVSDTDQAPRVRFLVARIRQSPHGKTLGPVWIEGGPLRVSYIALTDLTHRDCLVCNQRLLGARDRHVPERVGVPVSRRSTP
ncbi:hypothetical protein [Luteipulveratus mongoliensis]|uniref:Uncharacterized protein n=1 Tax=Luteipulveratus mongoliensis TaxID=571913 RepID=A0A0K1JDS5_9MICO|nr:hypothetical protein [Luteipulveratus mongoliensis]AKU14861.1 hypothetical protein VV02_01575 [Luteipulveratus mongoliensis]